MTSLNIHKIKFYQFLNEDLTIEQFKNWVFENEELERILGIDHHNDLLSYNFKSTFLSSYIKSLVKKCFDWEDFERWRTIVLFKKINTGAIEMVLASHKLRDIYLEQKEELKYSFINISLAIGYESEFIKYPIESEYSHWNIEALNKLLEPLNFYKESFLKDVNENLEQLLNSETKI
ncbi:hypothetical protein DDD_0247 [Nonlabens dokdonensis DSW-6]|uniref:Uncharacterized protein n=2 Tax=Nonlabens dokdonensis TaxID=328515 RepID=L7W5L2_NONDD|nr:hypothetical protein DDD_0247 [Nonlabens dokdonensis DSW-6]